MNLSKPIPLGLQKSFGFGDRLGLATPGHLRSYGKFSFKPIFAQQSIREMERTRRTPVEVMQAATDALAAHGYSDVWGADADHLKTREDVLLTAAAGFCFFTIDPSAFVVNEADGMSDAQLDEKTADLVRDGIFENADWTSLYLGKKFEVSSSLTLQFTPSQLKRAAVKYARAVAYSAEMAGHITAARPAGESEIEVSVDETDSPTHPLEHLFFALELKRRNVSVVSLAPRFIGDFEKGIDYRGDEAEFERQLVQHVAIAKHCGPYKISVHSGSDKFSVYPAIGRICGDLLHVKTAGTSYLEALRVVARTAPEVFKEIAAYSYNRFSTDRKSYHISTTDEEVAALAKAGFDNMEGDYLDERVGRQLLHVTFGSVLTVGLDSKGKPFKTAIMEILERHSALHDEVLEKHFDKHLSLLSQG